MDNVRVSFHRKNNKELREEVNETKSIKEIEYRKLECMSRRPVRKHVHVQWTPAWKESESRSEWSTCGRVLEELKYERSDALCAMHRG